MEDSRVDVILDFLKRNNFARAEAALRSEIDKRPDLNHHTLLNPQDNKDKDSKKDTDLKEKHIVKGNGDDNNKWEIASFDGEGNSEPVGGAKDKNFMFSNGSEDNLLDLYTWRYDPNSGPVDPSDNEDTITTNNNVKIYPSDAQTADTERVNRKVGEDTDSFGDGKVSWLGPVNVNTSKPNLAQKQLSLDKLVEPKEVNLQHLNKGVVSKDEFLDNPWSRNDEFKSGSSELWNSNCSVKTVFPFPEGDASTSYSTSCGIGEKDDGKRKSDDIRAAIKEQENEVLKALYFGKTQGSIEQQAFGGLGLPVVPEHP